MLIFATIAINIAAVAIWSAVYGANGFKEIGKLINGEPAFVPPDKPVGEYGDPSGNRLGPPNPNIQPDHPQVRPKDDDKKDSKVNWA